MKEYNCTKCGGFVGEPMKAYGYAGKWCHCSEPGKPDYPLKVNVNVSNPMTNNNDLLEKLNTVCPGLYLSQRQVLADFISQNFIPLSSLEKFIEENEPDINYDPRYRAGVKAALKLLKDKFIHE